jgi:hypothetical protein
VQELQQRSQGDRGRGQAQRAVAAWYWYKQVQAEKAGEKKLASPKTGLRSIIAAPVVGEDFLGGTAALRF